jgi:hypothetical protein
VIAALARFENAALEDPRVLAAVSVTTPLRRILELIHPEEAGVLGPSEKRARQALFFLPAVGREHLDGMVDDRGSTLRVSLRVRSAGLLAQARLAEDLRLLAAQELGALEPPVEVEVTGLMVMLGEWLEHVHRVQLRQLALLASIVGALLWLAFRRASWLAIGLAANALPLALFVGGLALLGLPFDSDYLLVMMIGLGVAVDDTMHLLHGIRERDIRERDIRERRSREEGGRRARVVAVQAAILGVGPAMLRTTLVVAVGLAPLIITRYLSVVMFGRELGLVLVAALVVDLLAVPAAITLLE